MGNGHPLGIRCPRCGTEVVVRGGSMGGVLAEALRLRAELGSVGLTCQDCGLDFLYHAAGEGVAKSIVDPPAPSANLEPELAERTAENT